MGERVSVATTTSVGCGGHTGLPLPPVGRAQASAAGGDETLVAADSGGTSEPHTGSPVDSEGVAISSLVAVVPLGKDDVERPTVTAGPGEDTAVPSAEFAAGGALVPQPPMTAAMPSTPHATTLR